jgi:hypothetical protein
VTRNPDQRHDVIRSLGDSAVAGGPLAVAIAAGALLLARLAHRLRRQ